MTVANMLPILVLMLFWVNYHNPIFGYIIFFGYFVDLGLQNLQQKVNQESWIIWLGWGLAIVMVGFLTPYFQHPLISLLTFDPAWKDLIQEYTPAINLYHKSPAIYVLLLISLITLFLLIKKRQLGLIIVYVIISYGAISMGRLVAPSGIIILCIFIWLASEVDFEMFLSKAKGLTANIIGAIVFLMFAITLWIGVITARNLMQENLLTNARFPAAIIEYMQNNNISGRIFNNYEMGGYLIYSLSPKSTVYIDGRTDILYPSDHFNRYLETMKSTASLEEQIEQYDINLAFLVNNYYTFYLMAGTKDIHLDYVGAKYSLYRKHNPNFPLFGKLLVIPACWNPAMTPMLQAEADKATKVLPEYSPLHAFIQSVLSYSFTEDKEAYLLGQEKVTERTDFEIRFLHYQAIQKEQYLLAIELSKFIKEQTFKDFLTIALANIHLGRLGDAERALDTTTKVRWPNMRDVDLALLYRLLEHIRQHGEFEIIEQSYFDSLNDSTANHRSTSELHLPDYNDFCPVNGI
ncbi:MAG: hypothetical protein L3J24_01705 [Xanthomonadales bacterium]|nr:hypothetical protein [Xanthomonadales bacterium]